MQVIYISEIKLSFLNDIPNLSIHMKTKNETRNFDYE